MILIFAYYFERKVLKIATLCSLVESSHKKPKKENLYSSWCLLIAQQTSFGFRIVEAKGKPDMKRRVHEMKID